MSYSEAVFKVIETRDCPYYQKGDEFRLSGNALFLEHTKGNKFIATVIVDLPSKRGECRDLVGELTKILVSYERVGRIPDCVLACSGCEGVVKLEYKQRSNIALAEDIKNYSTDVNTIASLLSNFSIFKTLGEENLKNFVSLLRLKKFARNETIIQKGDPGRNLFIILSGVVDVVDEEDNIITKLRSGEVFGEMSLISGDPVGATIKVAQATTVLYIKGQDFLKVLNRFPSLQMYFARLLSRRLAQSNVMITKEFSSGMTGSLEQMPPAELFQTLNYNQKTGELKMNLQQGPASVVFRSGAVVKAEYGNKSGKEAFFEILGATGGRFTFIPGLSEEHMRLPELGMFMEMLMEGLRKLDEKSN